jgi:leucyl aminopeptidase
MTTISVAPFGTPLCTDAVVIGVARDYRQSLVLGPGAEAVTQFFDAPLTEILDVMGMTGTEGDLVKLPASAGAGFRRVLAVGLGDEREGGAYDAETLRRAAGTAARALSGLDTATLALPTATSEAVTAVALGALLGAYTFTKYRAPDTDKPAVGELTMLCPLPDLQALQGTVQRAAVVAEEVNRARDLINTPANILNPESFADVIRTVGSRHGLQVQVFDEIALAAGGFGGIIGVGQGSICPPRLVKISHVHAEAKATMAFIGKGITYDSGGISLKPVGFNEIMKRDMSGAAAVFSAVTAASRLGLPVSVTGWLALAENMPSGSATRPGDVLKLYGGRTVEVTNTDAEGRIVLADALMRSSEENPDAIVDVATLTAAMRIALGNRMFGVMSNHDAFRSQVLNASETAGEQAWPMPLPVELRKGLDSSVADIANAGERMGGGLAAGLFLKEFVSDNTAWAHMDIAGPSFHEGDPYGYTLRGGTGVAVRTLVQLLTDIAVDGIRR